MQRIRLKRIKVKCMQCMCDKFLTILELHEKFWSSIKSSWIQKKILEHASLINPLSGWCQQMENDIKTLSEFFLKHFSGRKIKLSNSFIIINSLTNPLIFYFSKVFILHDLSCSHPSVILGHLGLPWIIFGYLWSSWVF